MLFPFYYLVWLSIAKDGSEFNFPPGFLPHPTHPGTIVSALAGRADQSGTVVHYFVNSLQYAGLATLGCLIMQCLVGYGFARFRFPGRNLLFSLTIAMMMMPFVVTLIPRFLFFAHLGLTDSLWPLIIPWWFGGSPYGIFLMRQFFMSLPRELDEAARVDGLNHWQILWRILVPQAIPVLVSLGILEFVYFWNDLLGPLIYTQSDGSQPISLGIFTQGTGSTFTISYPRFMAIALVMIAPVALMFLGLQRQFRRGFLTSGLGGR